MMRARRHPFMTTAVAVLLGAFVQTADSATMSGHGLWAVYDQALKNAKYIDLTHTLTPSTPRLEGLRPGEVWSDG